MKLSELTEAKPTKTMDPTELDWDTMFDEPVSKGELATATKPAAVGKAKDRAELPKLKQASAQATKKAMGKVELTPDAAQKLGSLNIPDAALAAEPDLPTAGATPVTADNVPAILSHELARVGSEVGDPQTVHPEWHQVKNLPGYMSKQIRVLGRETFKPYTTTPIEDVTVIANLGGQGPNTDREVNAVAAWLKTNGEEVDSAEMDYGQTMPGYTAHTVSYTASGVRFLVVKDMMGKYIYAWPEQDSVKQVGHEPEMKQLGR